MNVLGRLTFGFLSGSAVTLVDNAEHDGRCEACEGDYQAHSNERILSAL